MTDVFWLVRLCWFYRQTFNKLLLYPSMKLAGEAHDRDTQALHNITFTKPAHLLIADIGAFCFPYIFIFMWSAVFFLTGR